MRFLTECHYATSEATRGVLVSDFVVDLQKGYKGYHEFSSLEDGIFGTLDDDFLTIKNGYKSDLCSPAKHIGKKWHGTPTSEREAPGAFIHDMARRVCRLQCVPFDRKDTDDFFWDALHLTNSRLKRTYHFFVSSFVGTVFIWFTLKKMDCYCKTYH